MPGERALDELHRLRDVCMSLSGQRSFREYPLSWVLRQVTSANFVVEASRCFPLLFGTRYVHDMIDGCVRMLPRFKEPALALTMAEHLAKTRQNILSLSEVHWGIRRGMDYVVVAKPNHIQSLPNTKNT